jgi:hypothetical protein
MTRNIDAGASAADLDRVASMRAGDRIGAAALAKKFSVSESTVSYI